MNLLRRDQLKRGVRYVAVDAKGIPVKGTVEVVYGIASIHTVCLTDSGIPELEPEYAGDTDIDWDTQETVCEQGEALYVTASGNTFRESQLLFKPV